MTQVIHGLCVPDIERLKRTWAKVPSWEMRKFSSMKTFVSPSKNVRPPSFFFVPFFWDGVADYWGDGNSSSTSERCRWR